MASLAVALAGCGESRPTAPVDIAVYGDCRQFAKIHKRIARSIATMNPSAVVIAGDLVSHPEEQWRWDAFKEITGAFSSRIPLLAAAGNHDIHPVDGSSAYLRELKLQRTYFERQVGDAHYFVLDSIKGFTDKEQVDWFRKGAEASTAKHKFAAFHHPPFILDRKRMDETPYVLANLHPLLVKYKFCAGFCGHQHAFFTTRRDGIPYIVSGGGGSALGTLDESLKVKGDLSRSFYHFVGLRAAGTKLEGHVFEPDGDEVPELAFPVCDHA